MPAQSRRIFIREYFHGRCRGIYIYIYAKKYSWFGGEGEMVIECTNDVMSCGETDSYLMTIYET